MNNELYNKLLKTDLTKPENIENLFNFARLENSYEINLQCRDLCIKNKNRADVMAIREVFKKTLLFGAKDNFDDYLRYIEWNRPPEKKFYMPRRRVLKPLVDDLQDLADGKIEFLGISLPPRVGKSTLCIFFMTWIMGKNPDCANVMSGHSDKLTNGFYKEILSIIADNETYLWADVFPEVKLAGQSAKDESIDLNKVKRYPTVTCRSVGGTLTGAVEVSETGILYCDDLIEDLEEALNLERLQAKYDAYLNQLKDRKKDGARELMVGTRWSVGDPLGRIQEQYAGNDKYRFTIIPALNENDESNFNYDYGVGFSTEYYMDMRESIDKATWCAKYMGQPYEREGILYPEEELRRYYELPDKQPDGIISICDTKDKGSDFAFLPVALIYGNDYYIDDCIFDNGSEEVIESRLVDCLIKNKVHISRFESNSAGGVISRNVQKEIKARNGNTKITTKYTTSNKATKIIVNSPWVKEHCLFKDSSLYSAKSDYGKMMNALCSYTITGKNKHDDAPDGMAMLSEFAQSMVGNKAVIMERFF